MQCFGEDRNAGLYLGLLDNGLWRSMDYGSTWIKDGLASATVYQFVADSCGALYAATSSGLYKRAFNSSGIRQSSANTASGFMQFSAWPNPSNSSVAIKIAVPLPGEAALSVYDVDGRWVAAVCAQQLNSGLHQFIWNGRDSQNKPIGSGVYFVVLQFVYPDGAVVKNKLAVTLIH